MLCMLFAVAGVSASDNSTDIVNAEDNYKLDDDLNAVDSGNSDALGDTGNYKSFKDLSNEIKNCNGTLNIDHDYMHYANDTQTSVSIVMSNLKINGNGHILDGANLRYNFMFELGDEDENNMSNIEINNLTFKNFKDQTLFFISCKVALNDVKFINCNAKDDIIFFTSSDMTLNNVVFNSGINGTCVNSAASKVLINNSYFQGQYDVCKAVSQDRGQLTIENTIFENFNSKHGAILNFKGSTFSIRNSKFLNSRAVFNGGAIIAKFFPVANSNGSGYIIPERMLIENCVFSNLTSSDDGGTIFIDLDSGSQKVAQSLNIINSDFTDCTSRFGGAIAIQGGNLNINNSNFKNNRAGFEGGAIFSSWSNVAIVNSTFSNNTGEKNAGAIYFDKGKLTIQRSSFIRNMAIKESENVANAIYAHDVNLQLSNSIFDNGGVGVYADFASNSKIENVTKNEDIFLTDNKNYILSIESNGIKFNLTKNSIVVDKIPSRFDLRDWGWVSPIKRQGDNDDCWAFATVGALESSLLKSTGQFFNLSQNYAQKLNLKYVPWGDLRISLTGFGYSGLGYALNWIGALPMDSPYDDRGTMGDTDLNDSRIHVQDAIIILNGKNNTDLIKKTIMKYGAVAVQLILGQNKDDIIYDGDDISVMEHAIHFFNLIGWNDNYTSEYSTEETRGGWLVKDSLSQSINYRDYNDLDGFMDMDYFALVPQNPVIAYIFENDIDYHVNYQTDLTGLTGFDSNYTYYSNEFTSKYDELVGAVGTYFNQSGINYSFDIFVNGVKAHSQSGVSEFGGFRTIVLNKYIPVKTGDKFKVVFHNNNLPYQAYSRLHYLSGMSFVGTDGKSWKDITLENKTVCLKVYTVKDDTKMINNKNIAVDYNGGSYFSVKVVTADGRAVGAGEVVKFTINKKTTAVKTNNNGIAKIKITQLPKKYTITTTYKGKSVKNTVTVKQVLSAKKVIVKKTSKRLILQAQLKINGKFVKGAIIKFKFLGKTYHAKTNSKGIALKTFNKNVIKKLRKGRTYAVGVTYIKNTIKTTVKVNR